MSSIITYSLSRSKSPSLLLAIIKPSKGFIPFFAKYCPVECAGAVNGALILPAANGSIVDPGCAPGAAAVDLIFASSDKFELSDTERGWPERGVEGCGNADEEGIGKFDTLGIAERGGGASHSVCLCSCRSNMRVTSFVVLVRLAMLGLISLRTGKSFITALTFENV